MTTGIELPCLQLKLAGRPTREALLEFVEQGAQRTIPREPHKPWLFAVNPSNVLYMVNLAPAFAQLELPAQIAEFVRRFLVAHALDLCAFVIEAKLMFAAEPSQDILTVIIQERGEPLADSHVYRILGEHPTRDLGECQTSKSVQTIWKFY